MRDDYLGGVLACEKRNRDSSEIAVRDEFNRQHPPTTGLAVPHDLRKMELPERPWRKNRGHFFDLADYEVLSAHISKLKPGMPSVRHRHTTEANLYIVKGHGNLLINYDAEPVEVVEWAEGTLFALPRCAAQPRGWPETHPGRRRGQQCPRRPHRPERHGRRAAA